MANKGWRGNFFEDFSPGQVVPCPTPRRITSGDTALYIALCGDRTPRFCGAGDRVHPILVFHQVLAQTVRHISFNARANLGYAELRWRRQVRVGDTLRTSAEIVGLKENSSGRSGIVWVRTISRDQDDQLVLQYMRWVMVHKRGEGETPWLKEPKIPDLADAVQPQDLATDNLRPLPASADTGGRYTFEDYEAGERIFHVDGHTVNPSDHMAFTRLFQNSARLHFDARLTDGKPLVFGGYPMSVGYAQAFNGFENRLGIAAINGGTHANPVYAGDTLYSFTDVVERVPLDGQGVGALRCRLYVVKNENPAENPGFVPWEDGRYRPTVVLDLDFWELMPL